MTKKGRQFFPGKIGSAAPGEGPTHFFLNRALLRLNPAIRVIRFCGFVLIDFERRRNCPCPLYECGTVCQQQLLST